MPGLKGHLNPAACSCLLLQFLIALTCNIVYTSMGKLGPMRNTVSRTLGRGGGSGRQCHSSCAFSLKAC